MRLRSESEKLVRRHRKVLYPVVVERSNEALVELSLDETYVILQRVGEDMHVANPIRFLNAVGIKHLMVIEASSELDTLALQVVTACAMFGLELISEPQMFYHDTFPYRMTFMFESQAASTIFTLTLNVKLEV